MSDELFDWVAVPHPDEDCKIIALVERKQTGCGPAGDFGNGFCTLWSSGTPHSAEELARLFIAAPEMLRVLRRLCDLNARRQVMARTWGDAEKIIAKAGLA